ncbi:MULTISPECIES: hypothetical protein [unclassified Kitasatospora]|uniref:hypothetical protein n=1 Tax=unclassified Kitasatospora TaxID=2633591 RepID=UPI000708961E|nr:MULTISPECIES: hypothetical protein [unclassified Kitasatospora]KQV05805.1 hypothetical protein ASC99_13225 [Kitasatospora sp. Root107]KRB62608.1 hypothetical protein ASE03_08185 [Kitasatospora sp. Root187]
MDPVRVSALRERLAGTGWPESALVFAGALRRSVGRRTARGLLLVGTEAYEPWHLAAHLDEEATRSGVPRLAPTLLRHRVEPGDPAHLSYGLRGLTEARRGATVLLVAPASAEAGLLERVQDARRGGATVLALDTGDPELAELAHERLTVPAAEPEPFDLVQHLVSSAAGAPSSRLARLAERLMGSPVAHW